MRWFRLAGIPAAERLAALRLQVDAWRPFPDMAGRLVLSGENGLAIVWDAATVQQQLLAAGLAPERCKFVPETLTQAAGQDGLSLLRGIEGYEAQCWKDGFLRASRWWADALTARDWQEFVHASGAGREVGADLERVPDLRGPDAATPWTKHYPLHAHADDGVVMEQRMVLIGALGLTLAAGALAHQLWDTHRQERFLARQIAETKAAAGTVLSARDATMAAVNEVEKLAAWFAMPQPVDVIGYLHDALSRSGVQVKDLELDGDKLRLSLQLSPQATRAGIVKDLQAGSWLTDVTEVRADNARGLLTMDMRIVGPRPPSATATGQVAAIPARAGATPPGVSAALAPPPPPAPQPVQPRAVPAPAPAVPAPTAPQGPAKPIVAKPDANGMPPADVFNAIPNR